MKFDVVIIGGGLAGLVCGITLQERGKRCVIVNTGQPAMEFSSGSLDLLSQLPSGEILENFSSGFQALAAQCPQHPYVILGESQTLAQAQRFEQWAAALNFEVAGSTAQNHFRVTPLGGLRASWLSPLTLPTVGREAFPYRRIAVLGIEGYHDFQPQLLAENLTAQPQFADCELTTAYLNIPELDLLRQTSREFRSVNIAQMLEHQTAFHDLVREIKQQAANVDAVFLPACFGLDSQAFFKRLQDAVGLPLFELPTLPPSLLGIRRRKILTRRFEALGGFMLNGDRALRAEFDGLRVTKVYTEIHQDIPLEAEHFVLAGGGFFSNGLKAEFEQIFEPLFGADIQGAAGFESTQRLTWTANRFADPQPFHSAGVVIDTHCRVRKSGEFITNLYAAGNIIGGYNAIQLGCGSGVAVVTALTASDAILGG